MGRLVNLSSRLRSVQYLQPSVETCEASNSGTVSIIGLTSELIEGFRMFRANVIGAHTSLGTILETLPKYQRDPNTSTLNGPQVSVIPATSHMSYSLNS